MAIAFKQEKSFFSSGATSVNGTFGSSVSAGSTLFASLSVFNTGASSYTLGVSDNVNGTWTSLGSFYDQFNSQSQLFWKPNAAAGSTTVTATSSTSTAISISVVEYAGLDVVDVAATGNFIRGSVTFLTPGITTLTAGDLVLAFFSSAGNPGSGLTASGAYTIRFSGANAVGCGWGEQIVTTATSYAACTFTFQFTGSGVAGILAIRATPTIPVDVVTISEQWQLA